MSKDWYLFIYATPHFLGLLLLLLLGRPINNNKRHAHISPLREINPQLNWQSGAQEARQPCPIWAATTRVPIKCLQTRLLPSRLHLVLDFKSWIFLNSIRWFIMLNVSLVTLFFFLSSSSFFYFRQLGLWASSRRARSWVQSIGHGTFPSATPPLTHEGLMWAPPVIYEQRAWVLHCYAPFPRIAPRRLPCVHYIKPINMERGKERRRAPSIF